MKLKDEKLDPTDAYESDWAGGDPTQLTPVRLDGSGQPAVGLIGRADARNLIAIGPVFHGQEAGLGPVPPTGTDHTKILGGAFNPDQAVAPAGGGRVASVGLGSLR